MLKPPSSSLICQYSKSRALSPHRSTTQLRQSSCRSTRLGVTSWRRSPGTCSTGTWPLGRSSIRSDRRTYSRYSSTRTRRAASSSARRGPKVGVLSKLKYFHFVEGNCLCSGNQMGWCVSRSVPEGSIQWQFEFPFVTFIKV